MKSSIRITDLSIDEVLDHQAMSEVIGGARNGNSLTAGLGANALAKKVSGRFSRDIGQGRFSSKRLKNR